MKASFGFGFCVALMLIINTIDSRPIPMKSNKKTESISRRLQGVRRNGRSSDFDTYMDFYQRVYMPYYQNYHHNYLSYPYPHHPAAAAAVPPPSPSAPAIRYPYPYPNPWMLQYPSQPVEIGSMSGGTTMENKNCNENKMPASEEDVNSDEVDVLEVRNGGGDVPLPLPSVYHHHPAVILPPPPMIMRNKATMAPNMKITPEKKYPASSSYSPVSSNDELKD